MKRTILAVILYILLCTAAYGGNQVVGAVIQGAVCGSSGAAATCAGTDTYYCAYGDCVTPTSGAAGSLSGYAAGNKNKTITITTGGTVCSLAVYAEYITSGGGNVSVAIYDASTKARICQFNAELAGAQLNTWAWLERKYPNLTHGTDTCTVTTGQTVIIAATADGTNVKAYSWTGEPSGDGAYKVTDYTGGFPATWDPTTDYTAWYAFRVGVQ